MDACLEAGVDYLDTANYEPKDEAKFEYKWQWAYHDRFKEAGLMANDIIVKMDNVKIANFSDLQGFLGSKRPGDQVDVSILRDETPKTLRVKLKNQFGKYKFENSDFSKLNIFFLKV